MRYHNSRQRLQRGLGTLALLAAVVVAVGSAPEPLPPEPPERLVLLGGLFSLSGDMAEEGRSGRAAMELAIEDVNRHFRKNAAGIRFAAAIEDASLQPDVALAKAKALRARGVRLVLGPHTSSEVAALKPYVDANGMVVVSPSSTAGSLAIPGDNVFRFTPSDSLEAVAVSAMMWADGVRAIVPVWRDDPGSAELVKATRRQFSGLSGSVLEGVRYDANTRDFSATIAAARTQIDRAIAQTGREKVAVYLVAFGDIAGLFTSADADRVLRSIPWYGSNAGAFPEALLRDRQAAEFAIRAGYPNPIFSLDDGTRDIWEPIIQRIRARENAASPAFDAFTLAVYDAVWVAAKAYLAVGSAPTIDELKQAFVANAATHFGATGWTVLNAAGDRKNANFDFWAMRQVGGTPRWTRVAYYDTRTGRFERRDEATISLREREVLLGGLFSLTGNWSSLGRTSAAAMELAVDDVNKYLAGNAAAVRFAAAIEDTRLDPELALAKTQALREKGVQLLIGAQSSAEVARVQSFVNANNLLLVSPSSTAGALAIAGDNVFRFTPSDSLEGVVISAMMWEDGIRAIIPVWRNDMGNAGLERATRGRFGALGGTVLDGVEYGAAEHDFTATVAAVRTQLQEAIDRYGAGKVAVYLAAFDEAVELFARASSDPLFGSVRWYGSDGLVHSEALLASPRAVDFAIRTGLPNPIFARDEGARDIWEPLAARIRERTKLEPDAFALAVYDAVWVVARGYIASGATRDLVRLKQAFTTAAGSGYGATGWTVLNAAGDRKYGDFGFWAIRRVAGEPRWTRVAHYETRTGRLVREPPPALGISAGAPHRETGQRPKFGSPE